MTVPRTGTQRASSHQLEKEDISEKLEVKSTSLQVPSPVRVWGESEPGPVLLHKGPSRGHKKKKLLCRRTEDDRANGQGDTIPALSTEEASLAQPSCKASSLCDPLLIHKSQSVSQGGKYYTGRNTTTPRYQHRTGSRTGGTPASTGAPVPIQNTPTCNLHMSFHTFHTSLHDLVHVM